MTKLKVNTEAALDAANNIKEVIDNLGGSMTNLQKALKAEMENNLKGGWVDNLNEALDKFFKADVPVTLNALSTAGTNLKTAVEKIDVYSKGQ